MTLRGLLQLEDSIVQQAGANLARFIEEHELLALPDATERYHLSAVISAFEAGLRTAALYQGERNFDGVKVQHLLDHLARCRHLPTPRSWIDNQEGE